MSRALRALALVEAAIGESPSTMVPLRTASTKELASETIGLSNSHDAMGPDDRMGMDERYEAAEPQGVAKLFEPVRDTP